MTAKQVFEGLLVELSKVNAPSLLLSEYNYYINKAINQYINKRYNNYDINQQTTDDLRVLKASTKLIPTKVNDYGVNDLIGSADLFGGTYELYLPDDYLHMLNCVCIYEMTKNYKCYDKGNRIPFPAKRLTADAWSNIMNDYYNRPLPERPYYYIHNVNTSENGVLPTNPVIVDNDGYIKSGTDDADGDYNYRIKDIENTVQSTVDNKGVLTWKSDSDTEGDSNFPRKIKINNVAVDTVERVAAQRYGNTSRVRCEIRYGRDNSIFKLVAAHIDYIKAPQHIRLTQEQIDLTEDTSQLMEFPDYVCQEIINELVLLVMEKTADPRLQSHTQVTQSIANPIQQQAQPQQQQN